MCKFAEELEAGIDFVARELGQAFGAEAFDGERAHHARLRREVPRDPAGPARYRFAEVDLDFEKFTVTRDGKPLDLTPKEFEILRFFIRHPGQALTRERMLNEVWGYDSYPTTRTVDTHILKLRQKLEPDPGKPRYILSIYGEGYKFVG